MTEQALKGAPELLKFLQAFPARLQKGALRSGATAAARPIRDEARLRARKQSGKMAKAVKTGSARVDREGNVRVSIRLKGPHAHLGIWSEYGVAAHFISAGDSKISSRLLTRQSKRDGVEDAGEGKLKIGNNYISGAVLHPGHAAFPFMRPALEAKWNEAIDAFGVRVRDYLADRTGFTGPTLEVEPDE